MNTETAIVKDLMSKYGLTKKDLFSFCICAVNFLEYYYEESMYDMMRSCPRRYANADSNNTKAVAGALQGEMEKEKWTEEDQFAHYMEAIQELIAREIEEDGKLTYHFFEDFEKFAKVYKRNVIIPIMLGCPVEDYDDSKFSDEKYIAAVANVKNLVIYNAHEEEAAARHKKFQEEQAAKLAKEVEEKKNDKDFTVLLASCTSITQLKPAFEAYISKYYPSKKYSVLTMPRDSMLIIQMGGKDIEDVKKTIMGIFKSRLVIIGHEMHEELVPVEKAYKGDVPELLKVNGVTHVIAYY